MNNFKMIFSNILKLKQIYLTYFFSLILTGTIYLTFIYFINTTLDFVKNDMNLDILPRTMIIIYILYTLLSIMIVVLMYIANKMLFSIRAREYSIYRLIGITKKKLNFILFIEQFILITTTFIITYFVSIITSNIAIKTLEMLILNSLDIKINLTLSFINPIYLLLIAVFTSSLVGNLITGIIYKKEVIDLINVSHINDNLKLNKKYVKTKFLIIISITIIYMISFLDFATRVSSIEFSIYFIIFLILLFLSITSLGDALVTVIPKKYYYLKANSFKQSIITAAMSYNLRLIAITTILFTIAISTFSFSVLNLIEIQRGQLAGDFYTRVSHNLIKFEYDNQEYSFLLPEQNSMSSPFISDVDFKRQAGLNLDLEEDKAIEITPNANPVDLEVIDILLPSNDTFATGYIVDESQVTKVTDVEKQVREIGGKLNWYSYIYNYNNTLSIDNKDYRLEIEFLTMSQYNKLTGYDNNLDPDYMYLSPNIVGSDNMKVNFYLDDTNYESYPLKQLDDTNLDTKTTFIVYDDSLFKDITNLENSTYRTAYIIYDDNATYDDYVKIMPRQMYLYDSNEENIINFLFYIVFYSSLIMISIFLFVIIVTMLGLKAVSEGINTKDNYQKLRLLNYPKKIISNIANELTALYFFVPLLIGVCTSVYFILLFIKYSSSFSTISGAFIQYDLITPLKTMSIALLITYIIYYLIVNYNYKRIINL